MKENGRNPLGPLETAAFIGYSIANGTRIGRDFTMEDMLNPNFLKHAIRTVANVTRNEQGALYFPQEAKKYAKYHLCTDGVENIPKDGPLVFLINHYNLGPDNGMWTYSTVSKVVADNINQGWERRYRFIIKPEYEVTRGKNELVNRLKDKIIKPRADHILRNTTEAADAIPAKGNGVEIRRTIKDGDVLVTFPSAIDRFELPRGKEEIAGLIKLGLKVGVPIITVGTYHKGATLYVNFGKPITDDDIAGAKNDQEIVDRLMIGIARLLPIPMHGDYTGKV